MTLLDPTERPDLRSVRAVLDRYAFPGDGVRPDR
jgi:hypothetical protein